MYKCKICGKKYTELTALYSHIENKHKDMIPKDMSVQQFYYYMKTGRTNGNCVMCKKPTSWNHNTGKYNRFCGDEKCKEEYVKIMKGRMVAKYGKTHLLNDPNKQREMLANRSISGVYKWSDGKHETTYTGSYELDFLRTLDDFFDWDPEDISMPSPHTYTYKYEGEDKFYIPDVFIHSLDLEIEIKDGGDNPNNHHKIQEVDKEKERLKDEVLCSQKAFHYVKITNKNYENFFRFLKEIKKAFEKFEDETKITRIFKIEDIKGTNVKPVKESSDIVEEYYEEKFEGFQKDAEKLIKKYDKFSNTKYNDADMFLSLQYNLAKNSPKELQKLLSKLIKYAKCDDDFRYVEKLVGDSETHYHYLLDKHPNLKDEYELYYDWIKKGGMEKEIKDRKKDLKKSKKKIQEALDEIDFVEEKFEPDKFLVWFDKLEESSISIPQMNYYLQNQYEEEMRRYLNTYKKYYNLMLKEQPSAVKHINEDIKKCLIVIDGMASKGVENNLVQFAKDDLGEIVKAAKHGKPVKVYETFGDYIEERAGKLDRALIWLDKPKEKRKGGNITLYHGSLDFDKFEKADAFAEYGYKSWKKGDVIEPNAIVPGATALSKPRYGIYFWDNKEYAYEWAVNRAIGFIVGRENRTYKLSHGKAVLIRKENGMSDDDAIKNIIKIAKQKGLDNLKIYESEVNIHDLEITGLSTVKEYTVSKPVTITKVENVKLTPELLKKHCEFIEHDKFDDYRKNAFKGDIKIERNHSIPMLLALLYMEPDRDAYRGMLLNKLVSSYEDPKEELRKHGGKYRRMLNKSVKQKSSTLVENMVDDMVNIDDDVNDINCISVQDGNVSISNEIIECKLVYENSNARQLFSLTDTNSKLIINDELVIQRDKVGLHCSIKPLYESFEYENYIEFQVTLNGNEELNITDEKISEGVNISSLFKFNDDEYKFIKEACVKIFGVEPKEIKTK